MLNPSLPDVPAIRTATAYRMCGNREYDACTAPVKLALRNQEEVWFRPKAQTYCWGVRASEYERAGLDDMPALYRGYAHTSAGEGTARFDNAMAIRNALVTRNAVIASGAAPRPMAAVLAGPAEPGWTVGRATVAVGAPAARLAAGAPRHRRSQAAMVVPVTSAG